MIRFQDAEVIVINALVQALQDFEHRLAEGEDQFKPREVEKLQRAVGKMKKRLNKFETTINRRDHRLDDMNEVQDAQLDQA